jgi:hypothetical protein
MKVIIETSTVPILVFIIFFLYFIYLIEIQFVYSQTIDNELIANTLDTVEKAKGDNSEIIESLNNASKLTQDSTTRSDKSIPYSQNEFNESSKNWINGESNKLSFKYPSHWDVNISNSRFDNYELIFTDKASNSSIQVSDEALSPGNKILHGTNLERYFSIYMLQHSPLSKDSNKIDTYPEGKISIAGLPTYSELYLDQEYAILVSLAFQEGSDRHYTVIAKSPSSNYDNLEPIMLEIIKSITPKTIEKPVEREKEIPSNNTNSIDLGNIQDIQQLQKEDPISNESLVIKQQQPKDNLTIKEALEQTFGKENTTKLENKTVVVNDTDSKIGQEEERLKPISDDMLEYSAQKFGINLSLPRETNVQILSRIFKDPEVGLQSFKDLEEAINSLDDDPYGKQYDDASTLEDQLKLAQEKLGQAKLESSSNGIEYTESEWGIKINIQEPWKLSSNSNNPNNLCDNNDSSKCLIVLDNAFVEKPSSMTILAEKGQNFKNNCQCDSLLEFLQYDYTRVYDSLKNFVLIGDNQTIINGNVSAWQMEYNTISKNNILSHLITWAMSHDIFYKISYHAQKDMYPKDLPSVKEFINNIQFFIPRNESQSLSNDSLPSFMTINNTKEEKKKTTIFHVKF